MKRTFLFLIITATLALSPYPLRSAADAQNEQAADYTIKLPGADGRTYDLSNMRGQIVLASFGATWCQPCRDELRALEDLKGEYKNRPVKFFWITIEPEDQVSNGTLKAFARDVKFSFPILRDSSRWTLSQFSTRARIPVVVFFDKQGRFVAPAHVGMTSTDKYKQMVRGVLDRLLTDQKSANAR